MADVVRTAILSNAEAVIVAHNHPSGNATPSAADVAVTNQLQAALKTFNIKLLDHVVLGESGYTSAG